jgi:hypothetical protein
MMYASVIVSGVGVGAGVVGISCAEKAASAIRAVICFGPIESSDDCIFSRNVGCPIKAIQSSRVACGASNVSVVIVCVNNVDTDVYACRVTRIWLLHVNVFHPVSHAFVRNAG